MIPSFNAESTTSQTIESALAQTFRDFELSVIDDGSTDPACEVLATFGNQIPEVERQNSGPSAGTSKTQSFTNCRQQLVNHQ